MIDVELTRSIKNWTLRENFLRVVWASIYPIWRFSPRVFWKWRVFLLKCFGAEIGYGVRIHPTVRVSIPWNICIGNYVAIGDYAILYSLGKIQIGDRTTLSQHSYVCAGTHNYRSPAFELLKSSVTIGNDVWICAKAFIGPNCNVSDNSILAAGAVLLRDMPNDVIYAGNPARHYKSREN